MTLINNRSHEFEVCVVGGGMAGICAAIASARNGARTALVHDRSMLGGNASSEIRMWICGAHGEHNKETGILEEIQLENQYLNAGLNYSIWDSVLYAKAKFQPNLTLFLNCSCTGAEMDGKRIESITAWELTSQTVRTFYAQQFIDCSGDSILAAVTPAEFRTGRESRSEYNESIQPSVADEKTMGNSLLIQTRRTDEAPPYVAPKWAYKFDIADLPHRVYKGDAHNYWWMEIGGLLDTISDAEAIRDELMRVAYGVWDYMKNHSPDRAKLENVALEWIGSLPGKRENRRYVGDYTMTQNDIAAGGHFADIVAYGGWSMDDHHPAGLYYPAEPTVFHPAPSPYGIPYRSLYSRNIDNLLFAGRNISVTHAALSSTRVMATCALIGQAAGTAAALCIANRCNPRSVGSGHSLRELQATLMADDCWLPGITRQMSALSKLATLTSATPSAATLLDGTDRDRPGESHSLTGEIGDAIEFSWPHAVNVGGARLVFDSNLNHDKRMPYTYPQNAKKSRVPSSLVKAFRVEAKTGSGPWLTVAREDNNYQRLIELPLNIEASAIRLICDETWGSEAARLFAFEPTERTTSKRPEIEEGPSFASVRAALNPADLAPPEHGLGIDGKRRAGA